jgi:hypothetical protein
MEQKGKGGYLGQQPTVDAASLEGLSDAQEVTGGYICKDTLCFVLLIWIRRWLQMV